MSTTADQLSLSSEDTKSTKESVRLSIAQTLMTKPSTWALENQLSKKLPPYHFEGIQHYNPELVGDYRTFLRQMPGKDYEREFIQSSEILRQGAMALRTFIEKQIEAQMVFNPVLDTLKAELSSHLKADTLNTAWFISAHFRTAAALQTTSKEEMNLFQHVSDPALVTRVFEYTDRENSVDPTRHFDAISDVELPYEEIPLARPRHIHHSASEEIDKLISLALPSKIYYPVPGLGKFGISLLLSNYLKRIYLLGLPNKPIKAHGIDMSPLSFMVHDVFHANTDYRVKVLIVYIKETIDAYIEKGGDIDEGSKYVIPHAIRRHVALQQAFQTLYDCFLRQLYPRYGLQELNKTMVGLFLLLHEKPNFTSGNYQDSDLGHIISSLIQSAIGELYSETAWESPNDPFSTSAINGRILLKKTQFNAVIRSFIEEALKTVKETSYLLPPRFYSMEHKQQDEYLRSLITDCKVTRNKRFIDIKISFKTGEKINYQMATLYHKWRNMDDAIGLLRMAGVPIEKPKLDPSNEEASRKLAQKTLRLVRKELKKVIQNFQKRALFFIDHPDSETGTSLQDHFYTSSSQQKRWLQEQLERSLELRAEKERSAEPFKITVTDADVTGSVARPILRQYRHHCRSQEEILLCCLHNIDELQSKPDSKERSEKIILEIREIQTKIQYDLGTKMSNGKTLEEEMNTAVKTLLYRDRLLDMFRKPDPKKFLVLTPLSGKNIG